MRTEEPPASRLLPRRVEPSDRRGKVPAERKLLRISSTVRFRLIALVTCGEVICERRSCVRGCYVREEVICERRLHVRGGDM